jgi:hypothetical protein
MRSSLARAISDGLRDRSGSIQIMGAFMLVVAMGAGAVSVDLIAVQNTSERLQTVAALTCERIERADNAVYSNSSDLAAAAQHFIRDQLNRSQVGSSPKAIVTVKKPERSGEPISNSELQVAVSGEVETVMAKALGLAGGKIDVVRLCKPRPIKDEEDCTQEQRTFLVMTDFVGDDVTIAMLREMSKLNRNAFVMTLTDRRNRPIFRDRVTADMTFGAELGNRRLRASDRLHFQPANADGTLPPFCKGAPEPRSEECVGDACETPPPECIGRACGTPPPPVNRNSGPACDATEFIRKAKAPPSDFEDSHFDPSATREFRNYVNGKPTQYYYHGNELYKSNRKITMNIGLSRNFQFNSRGQNITVRYREIGSGSRATTRTTLEFAYLSKIKGANADTFQTVLQNQLRLVYVQDHAKALWEKPDGTCITINSPIVLALDGRNRISTTGTSTAQQALRLPGQTVRFDVYGSGRQLSTEWIIGDGGQALLVDNRDGRAAEDMNGTRLFGAEGEFDNGYEKLRMLDTSGTGVLRGSDLDGLAAWIDDGDAVVDPGELVSLSSLGITELGTEIVTVQDDKGFDLMRSWAVRNGRPIMTEDVWFAVTDRAVAAAPEATTPTRN